MRTKSEPAVMISIRAPGVVAGDSPRFLRRHPVNPRAARPPFGAVARVMRRQVRFAWLCPSWRDGRSPSLTCGSRPAALRIFCGRGA